MILATVTCLVRTMESLATVRSCVTAAAVPKLPRGYLPEGVRALSAARHFHLNLSPLPRYKGTTAAITLCLIDPQQTYELLEAFTPRGAARSGSAPLQATVEQFLLGVTVFSWDSEAAREYGGLRPTLEREGRLMGSLDMMIAARALALGLVLVTNHQAFGRIKRLKTEDWTR